MNTRVLLLFAALSVAFAARWLLASNDPSEAPPVSATKRLEALEPSPRAPSASTPAIPAAKSTNAGTDDESNPRSSRNEPPSARGGKESVKLTRSIDVDSARSRRDQRVQPYRTRDSISFGGQDFNILKLRAVPKDAYRDEMGPMVMEKMNYVLVPAVEGQGFAMDQSRPVLERASNGALVIVTGTFLVTAKSAADLEPVARTHGLDVKFIDSDLRLAYLQAPTGAALAPLMQALTADPSVESATLEVVQSRKRF